jgi:hypothetical protein
MKLLRFIFCSLVILTTLLSSVPKISAAAVEPFPPFSIEGNPPYDYFFGIFTLFRYFRPRALEIYENLDRSRTYVDLQKCPGKQSDRRDDYCNNDPTDPEGSCDGGEVDICTMPPNITKHHTQISKSGSCKLDKKEDPENPDEIIEGECEYTKRPNITKKVRGVDFSSREKASSGDLSEGFSDLVYPKIQDKAGIYSQIGTANPITWGTQYLSSDLCESDIRRVVVLRRAKQTKNTVHETGEWPLGWVDWGYTIPSGKTLIEMNDVLPNDIAAHLNPLIEGLDDFYLTAGDLEKTTGVSSYKEAICKAMGKYRSQSTPPDWLADFDLVPLYPPSFRYGYVRPSICIWELCCPTTRCPLPEEWLLGTKRGLYYDTTVSQAYNASLDSLFMTYPLEESLRIFTVLLSNNPLIRYLSSASPQATPSQITAQLNTQLKGTCLDHIPWSSWLSFGTHMDYLDSGNFLGPNKTCPDYELMPDMSKEKGGATSPSLLSAIVNLIWASIPLVDDVEPDKYHLLTIPDAMGQSLGEIQQYVYDTRDTLSELESVSEYNSLLSNIVDDEAEYLFSGESLVVGDAKRRLGYYTCGDPMFSSQIDTSIEAYALGTRIGCDQAASDTASKCDPTKFAGIIADSNWKLPTTAAQTIIKNSAMFVGGKLNPELEEVYSQVSESSGVPCEILAAHHFEEASQFFTEGGDPTKHSVANGQPLNDIGQTLIESAILAATEVSNRSYYEKNTEGLFAAMTRFNGGGNANCQLGLGSSVPYGGCPRLFEGEDDPYVTNMLDAKHSGMYLVYCDDFTLCNPPSPYGERRPGAFAAALVVHDYLKTQSPVSNTDTPPSSDTTTPPGGGGSSSGFFPETCGDGSLKTALGCLPFERSAFVSTILGFLISISGAIALVTMLVATIQIMTAAGDTKKIQSGRDLFSSAIVGLLFLIFAVSILRLIAGDIIKLPGF